MSLWKSDWAPARPSPSTEVSAATYSRTTFVNRTRTRARAAANSQRRLIGRLGPVSENHATLRHKRDTFSFSLECCPCCCTADECDDWWAKCRKCRREEAQNTGTLKRSHRREERKCPNWWQISRLVGESDWFGQQQVKVSDTTDDGDEHDYVEGGWGLACLVRPHISSRLD